MPSTVPSALVTTAPAADVLDALRAAPRAAAVCSDFDGTLATIVDDPAAARPAPGAVEALAALVDRYAVVGVLSGRPVEFLVEHLPPGLELRGLYGLESVSGGVRADHPDAVPWRAVVGGVVDEARDRLPLHLVEAKGLSLTLHYRTDPGREQAVLAFAQEAAARTGLALRRARRSVELHPPVDVDKGTVLTELAGGLAAACFIGDDAGDLAAFDALDRLAGAGTATARVAVRSAEAPAGLLERADVVVDGPAGAVALLRSL
jgi:trehalose 6-phosphate phosphatase